MNPMLALRQYQKVNGVAQTSEASPHRLVQMLMQGGHHPKLTKQWYLDLLHHVRTKYPGFNVHGFSPSEFVAF